MSIEQMDRRFGMVAIENGFITLEQLLSALEIQIKEELELKKHRLLGAILVSRGYMNNVQVMEILKALGIPI